MPKEIAKFASLATLGLVTVPCLLFLAGAIGHEAVKWAALVGTIGWYIATPMWMSRELPADAGEVEI
jgi:hypothetical protein